MTKLGFYWKYSASASLVYNRVEMDTYISCFIFVAVTNSQDLQVYGRFYVTRSGFMLANYVTLANWSDYTVDHCKLTDKMVIYV